MNRVWLVSYPKSGNTWFRMLIAALSATDDRPLDINALVEPTRMLSGRASVDHATMIDTALLTRVEADILRSRFYTSAMEEVDAAAPYVATRFYKVHDAYTRTRDGDPVLGRNTARAAIVLVRDPRDVAVSLAAHFNTGLDSAIDYMGRDDAALGGQQDDRTPHFEQRLLTWSGHLASWVDQGDIPVHLVRYESLLANTVDVFVDAMTFADRLVTRAQAAKAADLAAFERLQAQERGRGFREGPRHGPFFRSGRAGGWRDVLTTNQIRRIEADQGPMMGRLGYETVSDQVPRSNLEIRAVP